MSPYCDFDHQYGCWLLLPLVCWLWCWCWHWCVCVCVLLQQLLMLFLFDSSCLVVVVFSFGCRICHVQFGALFSVFNCVVSARLWHLFLGVDALSRSWRASILSWFSVRFRSLFVILDRDWPKIDLKSTPCKVFGRCVLPKRGVGLWLKSKCRLLPFWMISTWNKGELPVSDTASDHMMVIPDFCIRPTPKVAFVCCFRQNACCMGASVMAASAPVSQVVQCMQGLPHKPSRGPSNKAPPFKDQQGLEWSMQSLSPSWRAFCSSIHFHEEMRDACA